jgi:hypothetical protein
LTMATNYTANPQAKPLQKTISKAEKRSSNRASLRMSVVVYGWVKNHGAFHEETHTLLVNGSGALLTLAAKVEVGEALFLVNKHTREEQECRVAYVQKGEGKDNVGLAFKREAPAFWKTSARKARMAKTIQVWVRGIDRSGNPFVQSARTIDIGQSGARLDGVGYLTGPGEIVQVKRGWRKARFRVVWIGQLGTPEADQVGICCVEGDKTIWPVPVSESETPKTK